MAQTIKIKRSTSTAAPTSLSAGELAYSSNSNKLFVGHPSSSAVTAIGGALYVNMLDHTAGTLTASSAVVVDVNSKINQLKTGNIIITGASDTISTASGTNNLTIAPTGSLIITHGGTIDLDGQANSLTIPDNQGAALDINEGGTSYIKLITTNGSEEIELGKNVDLNGTLDVSSSATVNSLSANTTIAAGGNLTINTNKFTVTSGEGNTAIAGTLAVTNAATFSSSLEVDGQLKADGNVILGDNSGDTVTVTGTATFTATYNNGTSGVGATLTGDANGAIALDGVSPTTNDRVLIKNQSTSTQNGIYKVTTVGDVGNPFVLTRTTDNDSSSEMTGGCFTFVEEGSTNADAGFVLSNVTGSATLGSTNLSFTQFSGAGAITAGNGLGKSGNTMSVNVDDSTIEINSDTLRLKGVSSVPEGVLLYGANGGNSFASLSIGTYDSTNSVGQVLQVGANGTIAWSNTLDGGTF